MPTTTQQTKALAPRTSTNAKSAKAVRIILKPSENGSMILQKTARGVEFEVSETQLRFLTVCLDIARLYNDEYLAWSIKNMRMKHMSPETSRWYRDPVVAAETNRKLDEWMRQEEERERREAAAKKAAEKRLGL